MLYSIPIFHLNRTAIEDKWDDFYDIVHYHGVNIVPAALGILHLFKRFDISGKIINLYGWDHIIDASSLEKYTWWNNRYRYPILYLMWRYNYEHKENYLIEWLDISSNPTSIIGYVTQDMMEFAKTRHNLNNMRDLIRLYSIDNVGWFPYANSEILKLIREYPYSTNTYHQLLTFDDRGDHMSPFVNNDMIQSIKKYILKYPDTLTASTLTNPIFIFYVPEIDIYQNKMIYLSNYWLT